MSCIDIITKHGLTLLIFLFCRTGKDRRTSDQRPFSNWPTLICSRVSYCSYSLHDCGYIQPCRNVCIDIIIDIIMIIIIIDLNCSSSSSSSFLILAVWAEIVMIYYCVCRWKSMTTTSNLHSIFFRKPFPWRPVDNFFFPFFDHVTSITSGRTLPSFVAACQ